MVTDNGKYQLSSELADHMIRLQISGQAQRVLHACLHWQSYDVGWAEAHLAAPAGAATWCRIADLRHRLGHHSRDARLFQRAILELPKTRMFERMALIDANSALTWTFSSKVHLLMLSRSEHYTLFDITGIRICRTACDIALYAKSMRVRGMDYPQFELDAPALAACLPGAICDKFINWNRARRVLLPAARRIATMLDATLILQLLERGRRPGITDVRVRIQHAGTSWKSSHIVKGPPGTRYWTVTKEGMTHGKVGI